MRLTMRRVAMVVVMTAIGAMTLTPRSAFAFPADDPVAMFSFTIDATTHIKKLDQTITVTGGQFIGGFDLATGDVEGQITLPPTTFTYNVAGIVPALTATAAIVPTAPITGHANFIDYTITTTSHFNIKIISAYAPGIPMNFVGDVCQTESPVTITMSGSLLPPRTFSGEFTLPNFKKCQYSTTALNLLLPGPGNTFSASAH